MNNALGLANGAGVSEETSASPTFSGDWFYENYAADGGGGINLSSASILLLTSSFADNIGASSDGFGGSAMYVSSGNLNVSTDNFSYNTQTNSATVEVIDSSGTITGCTFLNNFSTGQTSGLLAEGGSPTVTRCSFVNNAYGGLEFTQDGGGAGVNGSISSCYFSGNTSIKPGAALYVYGSKTLISQSIFSGNTATGTTTNGEGGAAYFGNSSTINLVNCLFDKNTATTSGGALFDDNKTNCTMYNCTFNVNSSSAGTGGAMYVNGATLTQFNTIMYGDTAAATPELAVAGTLTVSVEYSDMAGSYIGTGNLNETPGWVNSGGSNYYLLPNSGLIGKGTASGAPTVDLAGNPRINPPSIGAYEQQVTNPANITFTPTSGPIGTSVAISGTGFLPGASVYFNGTQATSVVVNGATSITAVVPTGATTGPIKVTTVNGSGTSAASFTVTAPVVPTVKSLAFSPSNDRARWIDDWHGDTHQPRAARRCADYDHRGRVCLRAVRDCRRLNDRHIRCDLHVERLRRHVHVHSELQQ